MRDDASRDCARNYVPPGGRLAQPSSSLLPRRSPRGPARRPQGAAARSRRSLSPGEAGGRRRRRRSRPGRSAAGAAARAACSATAAGCSSYSLRPRRPVAAGPLRATPAPRSSTPAAATSATVAVTPADLPALAAVPASAAVWQAATPDRRARHAGQCEGGSVISEGVGQLQRRRGPRSVRAATAAGVTVGVLSDSFDAATEAADGGPIATHAEDVVSGDLPGPASDLQRTSRPPVDVLDEGPKREGEDEGRAMAADRPRPRPAGATRLRHRLRKRSLLRRRTSNAGPAGRRRRRRGRRDRRRRLLLRRALLPGRPGRRRRSTRSTAEGVTYLSAAGNDNLFDGERQRNRLLGSAGFRDCRQLPGGSRKSCRPGFNATHCMDFDPGAARPTRPSGSRSKPGER